jgi:hypothetical protein
MVAQEHKVRISCGVLGVPNNSVFSVKIACKCSRNSVSKIGSRFQRAQMVKLNVTEDPHVGDARLIVQSRF